MGQWGGERVRGGERVKGGRVRGGAVGWGESEGLGSGVARE